MGRKAFCKCIQASELQHNRTHRAAFRYNQKALRDHSSHLQSVPSSTRRHFCNKYRQPFLVIVAPPWERCNACAFTGSCARGLARRATVALSLLCSLSDSVQLQCHADQSARRNLEDSICQTYLSNRRLNGNKFLDSVWLVAPLTHNISV